jgi:hypothetical protein
MSSSTREVERSSEGGDLNKNLANQANEEKALFEAFLDFDPDFSGETIAAWDLVKAGFDPPDVICTTVMGNSFGVEICQWAPAGAMKDGRLTDRVNSNVLMAIAPQPIRRSANFSLVLFHAKTKSRLLAGEYGAFRKAFFDLINYTDRGWPTLTHRGRPYPFSDLKKFKPLNEYLEKVTFCPPNDALNAAVGKAVKALGSNGVVSQADEGRSDWIVPACHPQSVRTPFDEDRWELNENGNTTMEGWLLKLLKEKAEKSSHPKLKTPCSEIDLLIAFHEAIQYCPPIHNMRDAAQKALDRARRGASWPFRSTYLLIAVEDQPTVCRLL